MKIGPREAALIADFFAVTEEESGKPPRGDAVAGRALYEKSQCARCHYRGDSPLAALRYGAPEFRSPSARRRAPDLRYVRVGVDLDIKLRDVVTWRAKDADMPVVRALIESAREVRPLLQHDADHVTSTPSNRKRRKKR